LTRRLLAGPIQRTLAVLLGLTAVGIPWAHAAAAPPDSAACVTLQARCDAAKLVRVTTARASLLTRGPRVEPEGLELLPPAGRPAVIVVGDPRPKPRLLPWAEIQRVDSERSRGARYAAYGLVFGATAGAGYVARNGPDLFEKGDNGAVGLAMIVALGACAAGMLIGMTHPEVHTLYP
jgi:hypothetical protein